MITSPEAGLRIARRRLLQGAVVGTGAASVAALSPVQTPSRTDSLGLAAHALNRIGYGPRPGDLAEVARDPRAWALAQTEPEHMALPDTLVGRLSEARITQTDPIRSALQLAQRISEQQAAQSREGRAMAASGENMMSAAPSAPATPVAPTAPAAAGPASPLGRLVRELQLPANESRLWRALESPRQLEEVMVDFWFNHFNVFIDKNLNRAMTGHYEHYAIRPYALGRFGDLLRASAHHPAMLYYLDNWLSVGRGRGPRSAGGLNENYARELMELHTLGVEGGYTQADVTELARMFTGWSMVPPRRLGGAGVPQVVARIPGQNVEAPGFWFNAGVHDAGEKQWLGQRIPSHGKAEGDAALAYLASHPSTARNVAYKLVQYFVADQPDPALVEQLARVFLAEDGQTRPVLRALFQSPQFWSAQALGAKFKTPWHYTLSVFRALGHSPTEVQPMRVALAGQGMPLFGCPTPDGWRNTESAWLNPDAMSKRVNLAAALARGGFGGERLNRAPQPEAVIETLGPLVNETTRALMREQSADPVLSVALALAGPGMMRR